MRRIFGSRSDPGTPAQGTTPMNRSRASSSTRHPDDAYMDLRARTATVEESSIESPGKRLDLKRSFTRHVSHEGLSGPTPALHFGEELLRIRPSQGGSEREAPDSPAHPPIPSHPL